jgi:hypothetical protein
MSKLADNIYRPLAAAKSDRDGKNGRHGLSEAERIADGDHFAGGRPARSFHFQKCE